MPGNLFFISEIQRIDYENLRLLGRANAALARSSVDHQVNTSPVPLGPREGREKLRRPRHLCIIPSCLRPLLAELPQLFCRLHQADRFRRGLDCLDEFPAHRFDHRAVWRLFLRFFFDRGDAAVNRLHLFGRQILFLGFEREA